MKRIEDYEDYDYEELERKEKALDDNVTGVLCSFGFSSVLSSVTGVITGCIDKPETYPYFIAGGIIAMPIFFVLLKKLRKKMDDRFDKDIIVAGNLITMLSEFQKQDRVIDEKTSLFLTEIALHLDNNSISLDGNGLIHINQFLFLVNVNYYDKISASLPSLTREKLIEHILKQIISYYKHFDRNDFDENDAKVILDHCIYISPELKKEIYQEFKDSKTKFGNTVDYAIARKDIPNNIDSYEQLANEIKQSKGANFDITNIEDYKTVIQAVCSNDKLEQYGNPYALDWDMDFLYRIMNLIATNYRQELVQMNEEFPNIALVGNYVFNAIIYALVNNREEVGQREMLATFKNWTYLPFAVQDKVLTQLFEEDGIDYSLHPYRLRRDPAQDKSKVVKISDFKTLIKRPNETTKK